MSKYKVGDVVKVREDLQSTTIYNGIVAIFCMLKFAGENVTIDYIDDRGYYLIKDDDNGCAWSEDMFERLVKTETVKEKIKENTMKEFNIVDYKVYNNKAVIIKFDDSTEEKATCMEGDKFDLEVGVSICGFKHLMGASEYAKTIKTAMKQISAVDKAKEEKRKQEEMLAKKRENARRKKAKTRENRRKRRIADMKEAFMAAMLECEAMCEDADVEYENVCESLYCDYCDCE